MAKKRKLLERMKTNPRDDWTIKDVETLCQQTGLVFLNPSNGSHYKVASERVDGVITIPAAKPIKPVYIRNVVSMAQTHISAEERLNEGTAKRGRQR